MSEKLAVQDFIADFLLRTGSYGDGSLAQKLASAYLSNEGGGFVERASGVARALGMTRTQRETLLSELETALKLRASSRPLEHPQAPEQVVMVATATSAETMEVLTVAKRMGARPVIQTDKYGAVHQLGVLGGASVILVQTEMGGSTPGGSAVTLTTRLRQHAPSALVLVGLAFGVDLERQPIGTVLISKKVAAYDPQRVGTGPQAAFEVRSRGDVASAHPGLLSIFRAAGTECSAKIEVGLMLSGEKLVDHAGFKAALLERYPDAIGGEMEAAGAYAAALAEGVPWIVAKAVCDYADGAKGVDKDKRQRIAASAAADFVLTVIGAGHLSGLIR